MIRHTRTDPACIHYREPRTRLSRWWFDRARGKGCEACVPSKWAIELADAPDWDD